MMDSHDVDTKQILAWLHRPPTFELLATVYGHIPSETFVRERKAQLDHLVTTLGCLPLQHHIVGIKLWLRIDPSDGGGFGFELELDTVLGFVKHAARTTGTLVQSRALNDEKFMKWVTERVSGLPREDQEFLGFIEPQGLTHESLEHPTVRRKSERIFSCAVAGNPLQIRHTHEAQAEPRQPRGTASMHKRAQTHVIFTNSFPANIGKPSSKGVRGSGNKLQSAADLDRGSKEHVEPDGNSNRHKRGRIMSWKAAGTVPPAQIDDEILETIVVSSVASNTKSWNSEAPVRPDPRHVRRVSTGHESEFKPNRQMPSEFEAIGVGARASALRPRPTGFQKAIAGTERKGGASAGMETRARCTLRLRAVPMGRGEQRVNSAAQPRSGLQPLPAMLETRPGPDVDVNGFMYITIVFDGRIKPFLDMVMELDGVEAAIRVPDTTIIQIRVTAEEYENVLEQLSHTLGVASIS